MYLGKKENCSLHLTLNNVLRFFHIIIMLKQECGMRNWEREGGWRKWEGIKCWRYRNHYSLYFKRDWVLYLKWFSRKENYLNFVCKSISNVSEYNCLSRSQWNAYFRPKKNGVVSTMSVAEHRRFQVSLFLMQNFIAKLHA